MSDAPTTAWQTIDSAPSDEDILVFTQHWGTIIARHSSEFEEWLSRMQVPVALKGENEQPSHLRPLPDAPDGATRSDGRDAPG